MDVREKQKKKKKVRQGCPLQPHVFNIFIEEAIIQLKEEAKEIQINGKSIHCIRLADDIALAADSEDMNKILLSLKNALQNLKLRIC